MCKAFVSVAMICSMFFFPQTNVPSMFWTEKNVVSLLGHVFGKKRYSDHNQITPQLAAVILGVSMEMIFAHKTNIDRPIVRKL
jgi:hypothetical protein